jgi:hypothetical protein
MADRRYNREMRRAAMTLPPFRSLLPAFAALALAGCASFGAPDEVQQKLQTYYAAHAAEEDGACPHPEIASITQRKVLESTADETVLRVRYSYFDATRAAEANWRQVLLADRPCTGFAERDFTLERGKLGYTVVGMSGERQAP